MPVYGNNIFEGAAEYYAKFRPVYPAQLFTDLAGIFNLDGQGRLLDLGCGTGEMAIPLSGYFQKVTGLDPDNEMLAVAAAKASKAGISNIEWKKGSSDDITGVEGPYRLITMGQSFHWMNQQATIQALMLVLSVNGGVAIVGTEPIDQNRETEAKDKAIKELIIKYLGPERRAGDKVYVEPAERYETVLKKSGMRNFSEHFYVTKIERNIDQIVGNIYSMSWGLKRHFGSRSEAFEAEIRVVLESISATGMFDEKVKFGLYTASK